MSAELIAIVVTSLIEVTEVGVVAWMLYRMGGKIEADDAAMYLQGRQIKDILKEMRESLRDAQYRRP